jgi:uncharacterized protein
MFVNREAELSFFNHILQRQHPGPAQFILLYGRRRVGKTHLLRYWADESGAPYTYWATEKESAAAQRRKLFAKVDNRPVSQAPLLGSWMETWEAIAHLIGQEKHILILDELPYAAEGDPAMLSSLQHAWDQHFQQSQLILVICGSQVQSMETLQHRQSPLFGRFTGQWYLQPLPFYTLKTFFPTWSAAERVAAYAILGGIPAYLKWLDPSLSLVENIRQRILFPGSMFLGEPALLLYDEVREPQSHLAILKAIGAGCHTLDEISNECLIGKSNLSAYLVRLQELKFIERRLPATLPTAGRRRSRQGRYHIVDPYLRFFFRFIAPFHETIPFDLNPVMGKVQQELRAFVGQTAFEELAQQWLRLQAQQGALPFVPERIGSHWSRSVQIDVVGVNWQAHQLLLGECKWGEQAIDKQTVRELLEKRGPRIIGKMGIDENLWQVTYLFFARSGFTPAAQAYGQKMGIWLVDLEQMMAVLDRAPDGASAHTG